MGVVNGVGRAGRRVDTSVSGGRLASGLRWGGGLCPNSWSTWLAVSSAETGACSFSQPLLQICLFIFLSLALLRAESKPALNENRDDLNEKKQANAIPCQQLCMTGPEMGVYCFFLFFFSICFQLRVDDTLSTGLFQV